MSHKPLNVAVIGCGLIGKRRANEVNQHANTVLSLVVDQRIENATALADTYSCDAGTDWKEAINSPDIDIIIVSTPNKYLTEIASEALRADKHVLIEKPMGRNLKEAEQLAEVAKQSGRLLKIGFNHRYHPALQQAKKLYNNGKIGKLINIRAVYGHGARPGYEKEWRGNRELAGGGELTDQGVHICDLIHWFAGLPDRSVAMLQTAVWPLHPLEDNAFGLFQYNNGTVASLHTSWTQWKNRFSFEIFGEKGALIIEGLGKSYGTETLTVMQRKPEGGTPETETMTFDAEDLSWQNEWLEFVDAIQNNKPYMGNIEDGVNTMRMIDALYQSAQQKQVVSLIEEIVYA